MLLTWTGFLRRNDQGQDLAEYCLITAVIALVGLGLFINASGGLQNLWGLANSTIAAADTGQTSTAADSPARGGDDHQGDHRDRH